MSEALAGCKLQWSVWSIGAFSAIGIWKFVIPKGSYGGQLNFSRGLEIEMSSLGSQIAVLSVVLRLE